MTDNALDTTLEAPQAEPAPEPAPAAPRFKGISPELVCECPECLDDPVELDFFSAEEQHRTKGQLMLYCQRTGRKYFAPVEAFQAWFAGVAPKSGRKRG